MYIYRKTQTQHTFTPLNPRTNVHIFYSVNMHVICNEISLVL